MTVKTITTVFLFYLFVRPIVSECRLKLVIDHDGGADDAFAITMSLLYEKYFNGPKVVALTASYGNVNLSQAIINSARILKLSGRSDIPIYSGAQQALISRIQSDYFFGYDGLGDDGYTPYKSIAVKNVHAAVGLIELSKKYAGKLIVMSIAPSTNLALAIRMDPDFISRVAHLYIGAGDNIYNVTNPYPNLNTSMDLEVSAIVDDKATTDISNETRSYAEFNTLIDPEASYIVVDKATADKVTFVPYTRIFATLNLTRDWRIKVLGAINTPTIKALNGYERISLATSEDWVLQDPVVAAIVLDQGIVEEFKYTKNGVILCGPLRGFNTNNFTSAEPNSRLVYSESKERYKKLLIDIYSAELK